MSSSSANIFRRPARKIACVSARMTRINGGHARFVNSVIFAKLTVLLLFLRPFPCLLRLTFWFSVALSALEMVLVDHYANAAASIVFKTAYYAAMAINLDIATRAHYLARKQDGEIHQRADRDIAIHGE